MLLGSPVVDARPPCCGAGNARQHLRDRQRRPGDRAWRDGDRDQRGNRRDPASRHEQQRLFRVSPGAAGELSDLGVDGRLQERDAAGHPGGCRPAGERDLRAGSGAGQRADHRHGPIAAARHVRGVVRTELRQPHGRRAADVLEHADHADALRVGCEPVDEPEPGLAGIRGWHDPGRGRGGRRCRQQQLFDRRRHQQRQRAPHRRLAELRHDSGDARRILELRRLGRTRHRPADRDGDQGRRQSVSRNRQLPVPGPTS